MGAYHRMPHFLDKQKPIEPGRVSSQTAIQKNILNSFDDDFSENLRRF